MRATLPPGVDPWGVSLKYLMGAIIAGGSGMLALFSHMQRNVMTDPACVDQEQQAAKKKKKKIKMTLKESAQFLMNSTYIRDLAILVISYGMCINIVEVSWKAKLKVCWDYCKTFCNDSRSTFSSTLISYFIQRLHSQIQTSTVCSWVISQQLPEQ